MSGSDAVDVAQRRLAFLCSPYHRGGIERWMVDFASEWRRQHGSSWFVVPRPREPFVNGIGRPTVSDMLDALPPSDRPQITRVDVGDRYEFGTDAYRASVYTAAASAIPPGVPVVVSDDPSAWRAAAWLSGRNPFIAVVHADWGGYDHLLHRFGEWVAAFVGVSNRVTQRIGTVLPRSNVPRVTIACGVRMPPPPRPRDRGDRTVRLVWVGRMCEEKRLSDLPRIALRLRERGIAWSLDLMGDGEDRAAFVDEITRVGLAGDVHVHAWGTPAQVAALLARSDVLLLPSNREGMPITVMEALSHGCAVVASRVSGVEDYENHPLASGCYWVHAVGDVEQAAACVEAAHAIDRNARSERARRLAEAEFSVARTVERYAALLPRLSPTRSKPRNVFEAGGALTRLVATGVAIERVLRLWIRGRYRRPAPVSVPQHEVEAQPA